VPLTPDQCDTDEAKISFLKSLLVRDKKFQTTVDQLAQMKVSRLLHFIFVHLVKDGI